MNVFAPPRMEKLLIFGAGGFGREVLWLAEQIHGEGLQKYFVVDREEYCGDSVNGIQVTLLDRVPATSETRFVVALGDPAARQRAASSMVARGFLATTLIHPRAEISRWVEVGAGTIICAGTIITANIAIGMHVHINLDCTIGHDVIIDDYSTLAPGVHVSGNVHIGRNAYIGTGATIINGLAGSPLIIGDRAVIAAGACVTRHVEPDSMFAGVPAVRKR